MLTMKQLTIRAIGWGVLTMTFVQLPVLAMTEPAYRIVRHSAITTFDDPHLLAVGLTRRALRRGDIGEDVRALQLYLSQNGLFPYQADGIYGQETVDGVVTYQRIRDLPATGIADEETLRDMDFEFLPADEVSLPPADFSSEEFGSEDFGSEDFSSEEFGSEDFGSEDFSSEEFGSEEFGSEEFGSEDFNYDGSMTSDTLAPGSTGSSVIALQERLNNFGIPVFVDGTYGFETQQGVRTYQRLQRLPVTGTADRRTLSSMGFSVSSKPIRPYISAVIADESALDSIRELFPEAYVDRERGGRFINIGSFESRSPAEARVDTAAAQGYNARVIYRRRGFFL
ncbi:Putative peptidoglycan binding domain protein [Synechococcus sp. PCC 7335]|nr:Putative peptidoglycan binding domain protein [Synechococcus sp. PCC 7335]